MLYSINLAIVSHLNDIIRTGVTGSHAEIAKILDISRTTLFEYVSYLKNEMRAPIVYNEQENRYEYAYNPKFYLNPEIKQILAAEDKTNNGNNHNARDSGRKENGMDDDTPDEELNPLELYEIYGGADWAVDDDSDDEPLDSDINFNDLFTDDF